MVCKFYATIVTMKKDKLVRIVASKLNKHNNEVRDVIETIFDTIISVLGEDGSVDIVGFGSFEVRERKSRSGRNPRTGEILHIPSTKTPAFKPGKNLRDAVKKTR